jgi:hypothetical protein
MATPQLSPGVLIREVDLTVGRADNVLDNIGAIAGPFAIGPVNYPVDIATEQELINTFGKPSDRDGQYEYWLSASSYLSYGGVLKVVRAGNAQLTTANAVLNSSGISSIGNATLLIENDDQYTSEYSDSDQDPEFTFAAKTPGVWSNGLKVCFIDDFADQIISGVGATFYDQASAGMAVTSRLTGVESAGVGTTGSFNGILKGIIVGKDLEGSSRNVYVKIVSLESDDGEVTKVSYAERSPLKSFVNGKTLTLNSQVVDSDGVATVTHVGVASTGTASYTGLTGTSSGSGTDATFTVARSSNTYTVTVTAPGSGYAQNEEITILGSSLGGDDVTNDLTITVATLTTTLGAGATFTISSDSNIKDWYDEQKLDLANTTIFWKSIAPRPTTNQYVAERNGYNDGLHVVVIDDTGSITGIRGNLLEKHIGLSKALDTVSRVNSPQRIWWKSYLQQASRYVYVGLNPSTNEGSRGDKTVSAGFQADGVTGLTTSNGLWGQAAQGVTFSSLGNVTYSLDGGKDYTGFSDTPGYSLDLGDLMTAYSKFQNRDEIQIDYVIMGPGLSSKSQSQAKANYVIALAEQRRDCIAVISPHRDDVIDVPNSDTQTNNIVEFYGGVSSDGDIGGVRSSSYAVFDSGYKYMYDRFNNKFRYIPCNADVAGLMVKTSILAYPWFSPAGQQRGVLNNAIKLAYNPNKAQRDRLYPQRINAIVNQPGIGVLLFGDKTALGYASAFDRINVRRLFLTVEQALERSAQAQLFELNDEITRANFINIVEPYLRDVQAKRGVYDFLVICDETNNTPDIIDNNEFRADIYLKPTKSINYVTLTFVATRTGVSFEEVAGRV